MTVDGAVLRAVLGEVGIQGVDSSERSQIRQLCDRLVQNCNGQKELHRQDILYRFSTMLVPAARRCLRRCFEVRLRDSADLGQGFGELDATVRMLERDPDGLPTEELADRLAQHFEASQCHAAESQRELQKQCGLEEELFKEFRSELLHLHDIFRHADADGSGSLDQEELAKLARTLGFFPKEHKLRDKVQKLIASATCESFKGFLQLLQRVRHCRETAHEESLESAIKRCSSPTTRASFRRHTCKVAEDQLFRIFEHTGIVPSLDEERATLQALILEADPDGIGSHGFLSVRNICERARERLRQMRLLQELEVAEQYGFDEYELHDIRLAFEALDGTGDERLGRSEVRQCLSKMDPATFSMVTPEHFEAAFRMLDKDHSGYLDLLEFMQLVQWLRDREGAFKDFDELPVATLSDMDIMDLVLLLDALGLPRLELDGQDYESLLKKACQCLTVGISTKLQDACGVSTFQDLFTHAHWLRQTREQ